MERNGGDRVELTRIAGYGHVALKYGLEESIFLESIMYWWRANKANGRNLNDGRYWTYNTIKALSEVFPWWSSKQVRRIADSCREQGALLVGNYNSNGRDRTIWYSPSDELLILYGEEPVGEQEQGDEGGEPPIPICPNGQMHLPKRALPFAQMGKPLPCNNHVITNTPLTPQGGDGVRKRKRTQSAPRAAPDWKPERFAGFWDYYPQKGRRSKQRAMKAWDKLRPDDALIATIGLALKKLKATEEWQRGVGIPHAATFLNGRRWEDAVELDRPDEPPEGSGTKNQSYRIEVVDGEEVVIYGDP